VRSILSLQQWDREQRDPLSPSVVGGCN